MGINFGVLKAQQQQLAEIKSAMKLMVENKVQPKYETFRPLFANKPTTYKKYVYGTTLLCFEEECGEWYTIQLKQYVMATE